ncbi:MAG: LPS export ABC transporter permease LptG [Wenzhouxiangella sp.]
MSARRITLYLARAVLIGIASTCLLLTAIYTLIDLIREARSLTGDYGPAQMIWFLLQTTPRRLYDIFPFAVLIGTLFGLGSLAQSNELVAIRAAGFDRAQIAGRVLLVVGMCLLLIMLMAEIMIPPLESQARAERQQARTGQLHLGEAGQFWIRDGDLILRLGHALWADHEHLRFTDVLAYQFTERMQARKILTVAQAEHADGQWILRDVRWRSITDGQSGHWPSWQLDSALTPGIFQAAVSRPRLLALTDLYRMRADLERSGLDLEPYEQAFWARVFFPLNVLAMVMVALPFVFRSGRSGSQGAGLFIGVVLGLAFFVVSRLVTGLAQVLPLPLWMWSALPAFLIVAISLVLIRRL